MIGKYLDICTSHLRPETVDALSAGDISDVHVYDYEEGMFIVVPDLDEKPFTYSDLETLLNYAEQRDITLIRLDRDGEEIDSLPTYDWSSPKEKFLKLSAEFQQDALMETAMRVQETSDYLRVQGRIDLSNWDEHKLLEIYRNMAKDFEYMYFESYRYENDYINFTWEVFTKLLIERFGSDDMNRKVVHYDVN